MDKIKLILGNLYQKTKDILVPVFVLGVICIVISAALSLTNLLTAERIAELERQNREAAMAELIPNCEYVDLLNDDLSDKDTSIEAFFEAKSGEEVKGYILTVTEKGYGGDIKVMTAVSPDKKVMGVKLLSISDETPGLGQNVGKPAFYNQFTDKLKDIIVVKNNADSEKNEINAVTGATISSKATTNAVNKALLVAVEYIEMQEVEQ